MLTETDIDMLNDFLQHPITPDTSNRLHTILLDAVLRILVKQTLQDPRARQ